jgi:dTDP-4-dehydrorhamnose reductase
MKLDLISKIYKKRVIILGSRGMLGSLVNSYFKKRKYFISNINVKINYNNVSKVINLINKYPKSIVINCIGKIKQKRHTLEDIFFINSIFPYILSKNLYKKHFLVHPSTDCVFNGKNSNFYKVNSNFNAHDDYGISKYLGEIFLKNRPRTLILRTSIIGVTKNSKNNLLSWLLFTKKKKIDGYINHYWNGITTLEWCKRLEEILKNINNNIFLRSSIIQLGMKKKYSKYELLNIAKKVFNIKCSIYKKKVEYINRCLKPSVFSPNLTIQLKEFKNYLNLI